MKAIDPFSWLSPWAWNAKWEVMILLDGVTRGMPRMLPDEELRRLAEAKDFWVRAMVYSTFGTRLGSEWCDRYLKEVRERFTPKLTAERVKQLIHELGDEDFKVREQAEATLFAHRWEVTLPLAEAAKSDTSPEVRKRAAALIDQTNSGLLDIPAEYVLSLHQPWRTNDRKLLEILAAGTNGDPVCKAACEKLAELRKKSPDK
jgi:hypothetical protein